MVNIVFAVGGIGSCISMVCCSPVKLVIDDTVLTDDNFVALTVFLVPISHRVPTSRGFLCIVLIKYIIAGVKIIPMIL